MTGAGPSSLLSCFAGRDPHFFSKLERRAHLKQKGAKGGRRRSDYPYTKVEGIIRETTHMRSIQTILIILTVTAFGQGIAAAKDAKVAVSYPACSCHFGYGNVCITAFSCDASGGRCTGACALDPNASQTNR